MMHALLEKRFMVTPMIFLWCRLIISTVTKNRLSFFSCRLLKTVDTKNESLFLITDVLNNRNQSPGAACGQKIETDGRTGEAEKYLSARVLSLLILSLGPLSFLSSHSVLSLFSGFGEVTIAVGGGMAVAGLGDRRRHGEAEAVGGTQLRPQRRRG
jgi:hypothetical protein